MIRHEYRYMCQTKTLIKIYVFIFKFGDNCNDVDGVSDNSDGGSGIGSGKQW